MRDVPKIEHTEHDTEIFCYRSKQIETDRKDKKRYDSVLPIYPGSGVHYLIDHLIVREGDLALDLCTGSGVLGLFAADKAAQVIVTDISTRALDFARKNARNNKNIEFRQGDLFDPVKGDKFDYIVCNPPFVPIPDGITAALHTNGGTDGLAITRRILEQTEMYLKPNGRMQLYCLSLGTKTETLLEAILRTNLEKRRITLMSIYSEPLPLETFTQDFEYANAWKEELTRLGLTHLHSYIITIEPANQLEIIRTSLPDHERNIFPDHWVNWKGRFSYWTII